MGKEQVLKALKIEIKNVKLISQKFMQYREKWIEQLLHGKLKLEKMIERGRKFKDTAVFGRGNNLKKYTLLVSDDNI